MPRPTIGFVRHDFLPASETFIFTSLTALEAHADVRVFALRRRFADRFPCERVTVPDPVEAFAYRVTTWCPTFFRWARGVDLIHAHMGPTAAHAFLAARRLNRPLVASFYGYDVTLHRSPRRFDPAYWHYMALRRTLLSRLDRVLVLSRHMAEALIDGGAREDAVRIVPLGVDLARIDLPREPRPGPVTVLMIGREVEKKGFDDGFYACAEARARGAELRVAFLGSGSAGRSALERLARELGLPVAWLGPATRSREAMAGADILLVPSRTAANGDQEGTPTVICEGSAARLPVVSTFHAGIPEQVEHGRTGLLARERDVSALAEHLLALAEDPARRAEMGQAGRAKMAAEYGFDAHARKLVGVYQEVL